MSMNDISIFHLMAQLSGKTGATCVLIGGFAVNCYKVTRQTADLDFLITREDFDKIAVELKKAGFELEHAEKVFARFKGNKYYLMDIDFMFVEKATLDKIVADSRIMSIGRQKFIVPSLQTLIALKLHAIKHNQNVRKYKDLPDIINLIRVNKVNHKNKEFRELCLKYGTEELYNTIMEALR